MKPINLKEKLAQFDSHWDPHVVSDYNSNEVMVVKFKGEFPFHKHDATDDFFYVLEGEMIMDIEGGESKTVKAGELFVVPQGVVHRPRAESEVKVLLIEPKGEPNTGDADVEASAKKRKQRDICVRLIYQHHYLGTPFDNALRAICLHTLHDV